MPADVDDHVLHWLLDHYAFALRQRRMLHEWKFNKRIFLTLGPIAVKLLGHLHDFSGIDVAGQNECGVVWHVVTLLDQAHHLSGRPADSFTIPERVLAARVLGKEPAVHLLAEIEKRIRLVAIDLADYHLFLSI